MVHFGVGVGGGVGFNVSFIKSPNDTVSVSTGDVFSVVGAAVGGTTTLR